MIDIIIPAFNAENTIEKTLMSIYLQEIDTEYKVTIIDDASTCNYQEILNKYKKLIPINYIKLNNNSGPGIARQKGIDNTNYPYIVFIDSDDLFFNTDSLNILYKNIKQDFDIVSACEWIEETNQIIQNNGNVHAKIYKREFLNKNNIKFNETRYHEDNYFNNLVLLSNAKNKIINKNVYIYSNNKDSVTKKITFKDNETYLSNMNLLLNREIKNKEVLLDYLYSKILYLKRINNDLTNEQKLKFNNWINKYIPKYKELLNVDEENLIDEIKRII